MDINALNLYLKKPNPVSDLGHICYKTNNLNEYRLKLIRNHPIVKLNFQNLFQIGNNLYDFKINSKLIYAHSIFVKCQELLDDFKLGYHNGIYCIYSEFANHYKSRKVIINGELIKPTQLTKLIIFYLKNKWLFKDKYVLKLSDTRLDILVRNGSVIDRNYILKTITNLKTAIELRPKLKIKKRVYDLCEELKNHGNFTRAEVEILKIAFINYRFLDDEGNPYYYFHDTF